jgi:serine/threonine-protein kinase
MAGKPEPGNEPSTSTWGVRSVCRPAGCVATASRLNGVSLTVDELVFDQIDGRWVAVTLASGTCNGTTNEIWEAFKLEPHPDGTLGGEYTEINPGCTGKLTMTFTRTKDMDIDALTDPAPLPPRSPSPAAALHGRYHGVITYATGQASDEINYTVTTDCLRTGDRCMSYLYAPTVSQALVFGDGKWVWTAEGDGPCAGSAGTTHTTQSVEFPLPKLRQDPIPLLTGHGHTEQTPPCPINTDIQQIFTRTGD